jgi:hypothetical protein
MTGDLVHLVVEEETLAASAFEELIDPSSEREDGNSAE